MHAQGQNGKLSKEFRMVRVLLDAAQISDAVQCYPNCPQLIRRWGTAPV